MQFTSQDIIETLKVERKDAKGDARAVNLEHDMFIFLKDYSKTIGVTDAFKVYTHLECTFDKFCTCIR